MALPGTRFACTGRTGNGPRNSGQAVPHCRVDARAGASRCSARLLQMIPGAALWRDESRCCVPRPAPEQEHSADAGNCRQRPSGRPRYACRHSTRSPGPADVSLTTFDRHSPAGPGTLVAPRQGTLGRPMWVCRPSTGVTGAVQVTLPTIDRVCSAGRDAVVDIRQVLLGRAGYVRRRFRVRRPPVIAAPRARERPAQ